MGTDESEEIAYGIEIRNKKGGRLLQFCQEKVRKLRIRGSNFTLTAFTRGSPQRMDHIMLYEIK